MAANTEIERVRERIDIVELINAHTPLKRAGRSYKACCPFHQEKTPSFVVFPETQSFHCFGCGQSGDAFTFVMKAEGLEFPDALRRLAAKAGVELTERRTGQPLVDAHRQRLYDATATAAAFFQHVLLHARAGEPGRALLVARGINQTSVEVFGLGFAPDAWEALHDHLREREIPDAIAVEAGLLSEQADSGRIYDRFRARLVFPIRDREGRVLGFGGRALGSATPKYLNSAQNPIFDKSAILYGIDVAAPAIKRADQVVLVEGYVDALMAHQCGYANVVATMGTALTEQQVGLLKPLTRRLVLALDADAAGRMATLRGIETVRGALADEATPAPLGRNLVTFQRRLSADVRIMTLPGGEDPDSLLRGDPAAWPGLVDAARPLVDYVIEALLASADLTQPSGKRQVIDGVAPVLRELGDAVAEAHYANILSRRLGIGEGVILNEIRRRELKAARQEARVQAAEARAPFPVEEYLLGLCLRYPTEAAGLADRIAADAFTDARDRLIWEGLRGRLAADGAAAVERLTAALDEALAERVAALLGRLSGQTELTPARAREEIVEALKRVHSRRDEQSRDYWQTLLREVEAGGEGPDRETIVRNLAALVEATRHQAYYPRPSPYFKDIRDKAV
jgi:DNA primase